MSERLHLWEKFRSCSHKVWAASAIAGPRAEFVLSALQMIREVLGCERVDLRLLEGGREWRFEVSEDGPVLMPRNAVQHASKRLPGRVDSRGQMIEVPVGGETFLGTLRLEASRQSMFAAEDIEIYEAIAQSLGLGLSSHRAHEALRERVKELVCLYSVARIAQRRDCSLHELLQALAELLPPAWQYPELAGARLQLDGRVYSTSGFRENAASESADICVDGKVRGYVEVGYTEVQEPEEEAFLPEERELIKAVAREIGRIVEESEVEEEKQRLQSQLRHADRLATLGQVAAGVAHELNEPLGNVLGFAQLSLKQRGLPPSIAADLERIVSASLHGREIIKQLLIFARQAPANRVRVDLNQIVEEGLYFFTIRCAKAGVDVVLELDPDLAPINADPAQLQQVIVNLVVNALQAMRDGGRLTIRTTSDDRQIMLVVEDTGTGMSPDVLERAFVPFFTTKQIGQGTGLGLSVAHGIVTEHGGSIDVRSTVDRGTRFEIRLPSVEDNKELHSGLSE